MKRNAISIVCFAAIAAMAFAQEGTRRPVEISAFENAYDLQKSTGYDLGFPAGASSPHGGTMYGVDAIATVGGTTFRCADAILQIGTTHGLVEGGGLFCPVAEFGDAAAAARSTEEIIAQIEGSGSWVLRKNNLTEDWRPPELGDTVEDLFRYLSDGDYRPKSGSVSSFPIASWRSVAGKDSLHLYASIHYRSGDDRLRYLIKFSSQNTCLDDIADYQYHSERGLLGSEAYRDPGGLRALFSDRAYATIPDEERVALTRRYVTEICANTAAW